MGRRQVTRVGGRRSPIWTKRIKNLVEREGKGEKERERKKRKRRKMRSEKLQLLFRIHGDWVVDSHRSKRQG